MNTIEKRLAEYIPIDKPGDAARLYVSQLTREHLRKTLSFFLSVTNDQEPVPFQAVGTGTLNTLVLALLSFIAELKEENVIFAMEEPEIALPPHTQRRIAEYLTTKTTQCLVTSHSPYVIETFDPDQVLVLRRSNVGEVSGTNVSLSPDVKAKTYRRYVRRGFAEAMLAKGVILVEGATETPLLQAIAETLEAADAERYPLDLAGISIMSTDGEGSIAEFGRFLGALDVPTYALIDGKKKRPQSEKDALAATNFTHVEELAFTGIEDLLIDEVPVDCQWSYLEEVRDAGDVPKAGIPAERPEDDKNISKLLKNVLKEGKGWGRAAALIQHCAAGDLPATIVGFLDRIYEAFPRPKFPALDAPPEPGDGSQSASEQPQSDAVPEAERSAEGGV